MVCSVLLISGGFVSASSENNSTHHFISVSTDGERSMGLTNLGHIYAWGRNLAAAPLGTIVAASSILTPARVSGGRAYRHMSSSQTHTVAIAVDGTLWAWGGNDFGQLGDGTTEVRSAPTRIGTENNWLYTSVRREHSFAINALGEIWAWGSNESGRLGDGTIIDQPEPVHVADFADNWVSISAGFDHTLALNEDGELWAWGNNVSGRLGTGNSTHSLYPIRVQPTSTWVSMHAGNGASFAINDEGELWVWGNNVMGRLGNGTTTSSLQPIHIGDEWSWESVTMGQHHTIGITTCGKMFAWGDGRNGQIGDGYMLSRHEPTRVGEYDNWTTAAGGTSQSMAINSDGELFAWGDGRNGRLGNGLASGNFETPVLITSPLGSDGPGEGGYGDIQLRLQIERLEREKGELQDDILELESQISDMTQSITNLNNQIIALQSKITGPVGQEVVTALENTISTLNESIKTLESAKTALEQVIELRNFTIQERDNEIKLLLAQIELLEDERQSSWTGDYNVRNRAVGEIIVWIVLGVGAVLTLAGLVMLIIGVKKSRMA